MYKFTKDCLTGIEIIDEEHRKLFTMINEGIELLNGDDKTVLAAAGKIIIELKEYAMTHFAHEEAYMQKINDIELDRQKREHAIFAEHMDKYDESLLTADNAKEKVKELLDYLSRWLYRHILGSDIMIGYNIRKDTEDPFSFTDKYKTGIELIDEEHRRLFEIIKETNDLIYAELMHDKYDAIIHIIGELKDYTVSHFCDEEAYMQKINYEGLEAQKAAHAVFVDKLNQIDTDSMDDNQQEYLCELIEYLFDWLSSHILKLDKKIPME